MVDAKNKGVRKYKQDEGWSYVVAFASFLTHALMATVYFGYSVLTPAWTTEFQTTSGMTSLVGSAASGFSSGLSPLGSYMLNRFGHRKTHMFGGIIASLGLFLCSFATNLQQIFIFYGFLGGFGIGTCYIAAVTIVREYFDRRYALVMGIASSGIGVGSCVFPLIIERLESVYGWRGAMLVLSAVMANMCVSAASMFPNKPIMTSSVSEVNGNFLSSKEFEEVKERCEDEKLEVSVAEVRQNLKKATFKRLTIKAIKDPYFQLFTTFNNFTLFFCMMLVIGLTPMRSQFEFNMTPEQGAILAASIGFSNMIARFLWGMICTMSNKINPFQFFLCLRYITSIVTLLSIFGKTFEIQLVCCVLLGAGFGCWSLYPIYIPKMFDDEIVNVVFGYMEVFNGFGCLLGPFVGGVIYDVTGSFTYSLILAGSVLLIGTIVLSIGSFLIERRKRRRRDRPSMFLVQS